jgi:hypothetical protein
MISGASMLVVRFASEESRRSCCDVRHMHKRWGRAVSRTISRRLQQLEAMADLSDLGFMPFESVEREDGAIEVAIDDDVVLLVEPTQTRPREDGPMDPTTIIVTAVRIQATAGRL